MRERRGYKRQQTRHHTSVRSMPEGKIVGRLVDITTTGLMLLSSTPIPLGREMKLRIPLRVMVHDMHEIEISAVTVWCRPDANPQFHRIGFAIPDIGGIEAYAIETVLSRMHLVG
jgi:c-di-GMP-binding flagellar brake protein YcgR